MKLARHYDIEVSLFERMILNNIHSRRLSVQHRMRPEIAALISPHIYPDLENHPSVEAFPRVRGVTTNMFFFSHNFKEEVIQALLFQNFEDLAQNGLELLFISLYRFMFNLNYLKEGEEFV